MNVSIWILAFSLIFGVILGPKQVLSLDFEDGYYVTRAGIQFEEDCFESRASQRAEQIEALEGAVQEAVQKMNACEQRFSELVPYVQRWQREFAGTKVKCGTLAKINASRYFKLRLNRVVFERLQFSPRALAVYQRGAEFRTQAIATLIHETLHASGADNANTFAHNRRRKQYHELPRLTDGQYSCEAAPDVCTRKDMTWDRVTVLTSLCARTPLNELKISQASRHLQHKMLHCGMEEGCERLFTQGNRPLTETINLSGGAAHSLCLKIFEEGQCLGQYPEFIEYSARAGSCGAAHTGQTALPELSAFSARCASQRRPSSARQGRAAKSTSKK